MQPTRRPHYSLRSLLGGRIFFSLLLLLTSPWVRADWSWWTTTTPLSPGGQVADAPRVSADPAGPFSALWLQRIGAWQSTQLENSRYANGSWTPASTICSLDAFASGPVLVTDAAGKEMAVWINKSVLQSARYVNGQWGETSQVSLPGTHSTEPALAVDGQGVVTAVWTQKSGDLISIQSARYFDGRWSPPIDLSGVSGKVDSPRVAANTPGDVAVVWQRETSLGSVIEATRYSGGKWTAPQVVSKPSAKASNAQAPEVVVDSSGHITVVWRNVIKDALISNNIAIIQAARFTAGAWGIPVDLSPSDETAITPILAVDGSGNVTVVWDRLKYSEGTLIRVEAVRFSNGDWGHFVTLSGSEESARTPQVAADSQGAVTVVWSGTDGMIQSTRYLAGIWTDPVTVLHRNPDYQAVSGLQLAVNPDGDAMLVWLRAGVVYGKYGSAKPPPAQFGVGVAIAGHGAVTSDPAGIDCGSTCAAQFTAGATVTLHAHPENGYAFAGWGGDCTGTDDACVIKLDATRHVTARFDVATTYPLKVARVTTGLVTSLPEHFPPDGIRCGYRNTLCSGRFSTVTLRATPQPGFAFKDWVGYPCGGNDTCTLTLSRATTIKPRYVKIPRYAIKVTKTRNGALTSSPEGLSCGDSVRSCAARFFQDTTVTLTATPNEGKTFAGWDGDCQGSELTCTLIMNGSHRVRAAFQ